MSTESYKRLLKKSCKKLGIYLLSLLKDKHLLFTQCVLLMLFIICISIFGFSISRIILYFIFIIIELFAFHISKNNAWVWGVVALFAVVLGWTINNSKEIVAPSTDTKPADNQPAEAQSVNIQLDTLVDYRFQGQTDEEIIEFPDGSKKTLRSTKVEISLTGWGVPQSSDWYPWAVYDTLELLCCRFWSIPSNVEQLRLCNKVISQFEQDSIHFHLNRSFFVSYLWIPPYKYYNYNLDIRKLNIGFNKSIWVPYSHEEFLLLPEKEFMKLWKSIDGPKIYENNKIHNDYKALISLALLYRAIIYDRYGYTDKAIEDINRSLQISKYIYSYSNDLELRYLYLALAYLHLDDYSKALDILSECIDRNQDKNDARPFFLKGYVYLTMKENELAIDYFEKATEINNNYADAYNFLGILYNRIGNPQKGIWAFGKAIQSETGGKYVYDRNFKKAVTYYYNRSLLYRKLGKIKLAISDEEMVKKYEPMYSNYSEEPSEVISVVYY